MKLLETEADVVSCDMSNDSSRLLVVLKDCDEHFQVKQFCTKKFSCKFSHDLRADYIKAAKVIQDRHGEMYCLPYLCDGNFKLLVFNKWQVITDFNINAELEIDDQTRPNDNFPYPMMDACFIQNQNLFVNVFHNSLHRVYTFRYSILQKRIVNGTIKQFDMEKKSGSSRNFPIGTFFDEKLGKVFFFFRQGEAFHMDLDLFPERNTDDEIICQKLTDYNFGSAYMYAGQILVAKSSSTFIFYRL